MQDLGLTQQQLVLMITVVTTLVIFPFAHILYSIRKQSKQEYLWVFGINLQDTPYYGAYNTVHKMQVKPSSGTILYAAARLGNLQGGYHILSSFTRSLRSLAVHKPVVF